MATDDGDDRDASTVRMDLLVDQVNTLVARMDAVLQHDRGPTQTVEVMHKTAGVGPWVAAAVTACFFTFLGLILLAIVLIPDVHDLQAWSDILRAKVAKIEATVQPTK